MNRVVVCNSALAYPRLPDELLRDDNVLLPLIERFEEALFASFHGYEELQRRFPEFNLEVRAIARDLAELMPPRISQVREEWGHNVWELFADHFVKFSLGACMFNARLAEIAAAGGPREVLAWERIHDEGWWSGRQMVGEVAQTIAALSGARLQRRSSRLRRWARAAAMRVAPFVQAWRWLGRQRPCANRSTREPVDVAIAVLGPSLVELCDIVADSIRARGLSVLRVDLPAATDEPWLPEGRTPSVRIYDWCVASDIADGRRDLLAAPLAARQVCRRLADFRALSQLPPPMLQVVRRRLWPSIVRDLTFCAYHARLWKRLLDTLRPRVLLTFVAFNEFLAPGVLQANHRGIPTVCLQHGIWGPYFRAGALLPYDEVLVFGDYAREMLEPIASPRTQFTMTGHPAHDRPSAPARRNGQLRAELAGDLDAVVLVTTQATERRLAAYERRWWIECTAEACERLGARMVIKVHPQETDLSAYEAVARAHPGLVRVVRHGEISLDELICASDLLMTRFSTTAVEAALLETPVVTVNLVSRRDQYPYAAEGAAVGAYSCEEIEAALRTLLTDEAARRELLAGQRRFLDRHLGIRDGRAAERVAERIVAHVGRSEAVRGGNL